MEPIGICGLQFVQQVTGDECKTPLLLCWIYFSRIKPYQCSILRFFFFHVNTVELPCICTCTLFRRSSLQLNWSLKGSNFAIYVGFVFTQILVPVCPWFHCCTSALSNVISCVSTLIICVWNCTANRRRNLLISLSDVAHAKTVDNGEQVSREGCAIPMTPWPAGTISAITLPLSSAFYHRPFTETFQIKKGREKYRKSKMERERGDEECFCCPERSSLLLSMKKNAADEERRCWKKV